MLHLNENILTAMDVETTGREAGFNDVVQIALLPLDETTLDPHPKFPPFYQNICPTNPDRVEAEAMKVNGLDIEELMQCPSADQVADMMIDWKDGLGLFKGKRLIPLCQNSPFDIAFVKAWLGNDLYDTIFSRRGRDTMYLASGINDAFAWKGQELPFHQVGLKSLCKKFGIDIDGHHDALADCIATAKLYRELLRYE